MPASRSDPGTVAHCRIKYKPLAIATLSMRAKEKTKAADAEYACRFEAEPEGGYTVTCPALPSVVSFGETLDEARTNVREAIELCLEVFHEQGQPIPPADTNAPSPSLELIKVKLRRV